MKVNKNNLADKVQDWTEIQNLTVESKNLANDILRETEILSNSGKFESLPNEIWKIWLKWTGKSLFLKSLDKRSLQYQWADLALKVIQHTRFTLLDLLIQRVEENPRRILFQDMSPSIPVRWSYQQIYLHLQEIAAVFHQSVHDTPRVALFTDNCVEGACCDLACLCYDILDTPLNIHFQDDVLINIFNRLKINVAVTDTEERCRKLEGLRHRTDQPFRIFVINPGIVPSSTESVFLGKECKRLNFREIENILSCRKQRSVDQVATVMFTSGSTGIPKGVCFSLYNLVSKRFARAAALPEVGKNEILLSYLPLFHTFGRFLEMLGMIYWNGTYVFSGNPSADTLISLFPIVNPTGFISIPLRWVQLYERSLEFMKPIPDGKLQSKAFRQVAGNCLYWGLSAAGYLDPKIFQFFQRNGVDLCSGFGMTEATGGITMTPPGEYVPGSTGIPLPGIESRFGDKGELEISGHYIARYLDDIEPDDIIHFPESQDKDYWLSTGDLFRVLENGHYEIIDRVKDIYKNNKGQTIAPRKLEKKFIGVAGIKRAFLVGDGKPYNVLFIVPDRDDPVYLSMESEESRRDYFHQLVYSANQDLAPYERVVNFTLLNRDFEIEKKELTPKGTFNRKTIVKNFAEEIELLYQRNYIELEFNQIKVHIPRWFYRDLGILEDDILFWSEGLINRSTGQVLPIKAAYKPASFLIGDLEYIIKGDTIDLGQLTRQPRFWIGNPALIQFCPCKEGWDMPLESQSTHVFRPWEPVKVYDNEILPELHRIRDQNLITLNRLICCALFCRPDISKKSVDQLGSFLKQADERSADVIRRRLEALARHPVEDIRCMAYRILLLDEPTPDYSKAFPAFIHSGLTFLNEESIKVIAFGKLERRRLEALRRRLYTYRLHLNWPINETTRQQFINIFKLLSRFVSYHPEFYNSVRAELASWKLHKADLKLARAAEKILTKLYQDYETRLSKETPETRLSDWNNRLVFEDGISDSEIRRIKKVLVSTTFLKQSVILAFDEITFDLNDVPKGGIWISAIQSSHNFHRYRMSVNTKHGKHYFLQLVLRGDLEAASVMESIYWLIAVAGFPYGSPVLPRLGCYRPELGAWSVTYIGELTIWEKIRQYSSIHSIDQTFHDPRVWRKMIIQALTAFYRGWFHSGYQIVPGAVSPNNVAVPELDFQEGAKINSMTGWTRYKNTLSLIQPMLVNFYHKTIAHYPWCKDELNVTWIFDACFEALGMDSAWDFMNRLKKDLTRNSRDIYNGRKLKEIVENYCEERKLQFYVPLSLHNAVERYQSWEDINPTGTSTAKEQTLIELYRLYQMHRYSEIARYYLFRHTYFSNADEKVKTAFDRLLNALMREKKSAIQLLELSDLQSSLTTQDDRDVFSRLVFPRLQSPQKVEVLKVGESERKQVIVQSAISDRQGETYTIREPVEPVEIGQIFRLFFEENYPKTISDQDRYLIVLDAQEQIIGGICYKRIDENIAQLDGTVVASFLKERGIGSAMIEDFCNRMASQGIQILKTHFFLPQFYLKLGFKVDQRWGALVKFLTPQDFERVAVSDNVIPI